MARPTAKATGPEVPARRRRRSSVRVRKKARPAAVGYSDKVPARKLARLAGFAIDKVLLHGIVLAFGAIFAIVGSPIFSFFYFATHDSTLGSGRSLGRGAVGQRLMTVDGEPVSHLVAAMRNAVRWVLWATILPLLIDLGLVLFGNGRIIADYIFDTRVYEDPLRLHQRFLASGRDEAGLERARQDEWEAELDDEFLAEARREVEGVAQGDPNTEELDDFDRRLGEQGQSEDSNLLGDLSDADLDAMRAELAEFEERLDVVAETAEHAQAEVAEAAEVVVAQVEVAPAELGVDES